MSPTALDAPGHHDSFSLPRGGEEQVKVHSSAKRSPEGGLITVESDDVVYDESEIKAKYTDRGAHVTSEFDSDIPRYHFLHLPLPEILSKSVLVSSRMGIKAQSHNSSKLEHPPRPAFILSYL
jgi:hypothetical protein